MHIFGFLCDAIFFFKDFKNKDWIFLAAKLKLESVCLKFVLFNFPKVRIPFIKIISLKQPDYHN